MTIEELITKLQEIAKEHPGCEVKDHYSYEITNAYFPTTVGWCILDTVE